MGGMIGKALLCSLLGLVVLFVGLELDGVPNWAALTGFVFLTLLGVWFPVSTARRVRRGYPGLKTMDGVRQGTAEILEAGELPIKLYMGEGEGYAPSAYQLKVRVSLLDAPPYETRTYAAAYPYDINHLRPGSRIPVFVHPTKPKKMHLDFESVRPGPGSTINVNVIGDRVRSEASDAIKQATGMDLGELINQALATGSVQIPPDATIEVTIDDGEDDVV